MFRLSKTALMMVLCATIGFAAEPTKPTTPTTNPAKFNPGDKAPAFEIKGPDGKMINLADLTDKGPVLVRLTCGCSGCDKELAYFQAIHNAYKDSGLISLAVFKEPDDKMAKYATEKKINMLYAVDTKGSSWDVFRTKTMPTNILIDKGGRIVAVSAGCDPSGLIAQKLSEKIAKTIDTPVADVKKKVEDEKKK
jgi:peroxiredoxin